MKLFEVKDLILLVVGFTLSIIGALVGATVQRKVDRSREQRPLNQILNFGDDPILFIFSHRDEVSGSFLPRTSTEDFLAMNNVISALILVGWTKTFAVRDTNHLSDDDKKRNLVIICSPKSNNFAREVQAYIKEKNIPAYEFIPSANNQWHISDGHASYISKSFEQERKYLDDGHKKSDLVEKSFEDYAIITKITNPWNPDNKIIWVSGIRGIGTWGAAECLKKKWRQIYRKLPTGHKDADFSALLHIKYANCDITDIDILNVKKLAEHSLDEV